MRQLNLSDMSKSYGVFVDDMYYYDFVALYNSWKYYGNKVPIKVYSHSNLSIERKRKIGNHCEVVEVENSLRNKHSFTYNYLFKFVGLLKGMSDCEILLDADTIMLSNMDHLFDVIQKGVFIGVNEFQNQKFIHGTHCLSEEQRKKEYEHAKFVLKKHTPEYQEKYKLDTEYEIFNAGLYGLNKSVHSYLLEKSIEIIDNNVFNKNNVAFQTEQYIFSFLLHLSGLPINSLSTNQWMPTWDRHSNPKKSITVIDGKLCLSNDDGSRVNFYHFTGDIGMLNKQSGVVKSCRPHQLFETQPYEFYFSPEDVYRLWIEKHSNPVILLYEKFARMGVT